VICLTGDLHHQSLRTGNQLHCELSELVVAQRFLRLLEEAKVKVSFFVTGRAAAEQADELRPIVDSEWVELGGHTYRCFSPALPHRIWKKLAGNYNGPAPYESLDVWRTVDILRRRFGRRIVLWRNHMYMHGPNTAWILAAHGIRLFSDGVRRNARGPEPHPAGLLSFPINVMPDHEHIFHAERSREWVARWQQRYAWRDDFGPDSYPIEEWTDQVLAGLAANEAAGAISNMIIHPITMYLADRFRSFERILGYLEGREVVHLGSLVDANVSAQGGAR